MNAVGQVGIDDFVDRFPLFETSVRELRCRFGRDARHLCFVAAGVGDYFVLGSGVSPVIQVSNAPPEMLICSLSTSVHVSSPVLR